MSISTHLVIFWQSASFLLQSRFQGTCLLHLSQDTEDFYTQSHWCSMKVKKRKVKLWATLKLIMIIKHVSFDIINIIGLLLTNDLGIFGQMCFKPKKTYNAKHIRHFSLYNKYAKLFFPLFNSNSVPLINWVMRNIVVMQCSIQTCGTPLLCN